MTTLGTERRRVSLAGVHVDLMDLEPAVAHIADRAAQSQPHARPLSVVSANLDHLAQFGATGRWYDTLDYRLGQLDLDGVPQAVSDRPLSEPASDWLTLLDGAPLVAEASRLTGRPWPRLAGSDLIGPLLDRAERDGTTVGFLGGSYVIQRLLSRQLTRARPHLIVSGMWSPDRAALAEHNASLDLAAAIAASGTQLLVVGLGKPRQELWMAKYGPYTGANVLLAFGAVVDFLAGGVQRAPGWAARHGLEWAWRLALEPRRLARRYLVDDPPSLIQMRRDSHVLDAGGNTETPFGAAVLPQLDGLADRSFVGVDETADVVVHIITHNNGNHLDDLIAGLRHEASTLRLRVVVADNTSPDGSVSALHTSRDVIVVPTGGNLGYAGGINTAMRLGGAGEAILVLSPGLTIEPGSIRAMLRRMQRSTAGIVVPKMLTPAGGVYPSVRREPTRAAAFGDALFGSRTMNRPRLLTEIEYQFESYQHPHRIAWASGAAVMIRGDLAERLGEWDEQFFLYSEETDYFRRAREVGEAIWYEPAACVTLPSGHAATTPTYNALMAVNRIRYIRKYHPDAYARSFTAAVVLAEVLRCWKPERRGVLSTVLDENTWHKLPGPTAAERLTKVLEDFPSGSVIIPAHNEATVIDRTLNALEPVIATGRVEVIVACNGCTDGTEQVVAKFPDVRLIQVREASKPAALNAADAVATRWPRLYLDADIVLNPAALRMTLNRLASGRVLAARPAFRYDDRGATTVVKAFYRARRRIPSTSRALWGAGVYGLSREGHARVNRFPTMTADDLFVDQQFSDAEKCVVHAPPVPVRTPQSLAALMGTLRRNYRGQSEFRCDLNSRVPNDLGRTKNTAFELMASMKGPLSIADAMVYAVLVTAARFSRTTGTWERDETSRLDQREQL